MKCRFMQHFIWVFTACQSTCLRVKLKRVKLEDQQVKLQWCLINCYFNSLTPYLIETPFNTFAKRADPDQVALVRAT